MTLKQKIEKLGVTTRSPYTIKIGDTVNCIDFDGYRSTKLVTQIDKYGINLYQHVCGYEYEACFYPYCSGHGDELLIID